MTFHGSDLRQTSKSRCPMSLWTASTVSLSCFEMAWPLSDSTLKLLVWVGKIRNATIVISLFSLCSNQRKNPHNATFRWFILDFIHLFMLFQKYNAKFRVEICFMKHPEVAEVKLIIVIVTYSSQYCNSYINHDC